MHRIVSGRSDYSNFGVQIHDVHLRNLDVLFILVLLADTISIYPQVLQSKPNGYFHSVLDRGWSGMRKTFQGWLRIWD
jgi:hypothetical protein